MTLASPMVILQEHVGNVDVQRSAIRIRADVITGLVPTLAVQYSASWVGCTAVGLCEHFVNSPFMMPACTCNDEHSCFQRFIEEPP